MTTNDLVEALVAARRHHAQLAPAEWASVLASAERAYAVQDATALALGWFAGAAPKYWKSGGPSRDAALTHAPLPPAGVRQGVAQFSGWPLHMRLIEAEIALRLGTVVDAAMAARLTPEDAHALVDAMAVSIEVVDTRWLDFKDAPPLLKLADLQSHGALALGAWVPYERRDWAAQTCVARIGTQDPVHRRGTHSLGDPAWLLPTWLRHVTRHGAGVAAGTVVTTGTWVGMLPAAAGDDVSVEFAGIGRAELRL